MSPRLPSSSRRKMRRRYRKIWELDQAYITKYPGQFCEEQYKNKIKKFKKMARNG